MLVIVSLTTLTTLKADLNDHATDSKLIDRFYLLVFEKSDIGNQYIYPIPQKSDILDLNMNTIHKTYITHIYVTRFNPLFLNQTQKSYRILITSR